MVELEKGKIRRIRKAITVRAEQLESIKPYTKEAKAEAKAYVRGLEFALNAVDKEFGDII
jgi:hypothetical protein